MVRVLISLLVSLGLIIASGCGDDKSTPMGPANHAPVIQPQSDTSVALGDTLELWARAHDPDGDDLSYALGVHLTLAELGQGYIPDYGFDGATGYFWFRPKADDAPARRFTFYASDGRGGTDSTIFNVAVRSACAEVDLPCDQISNTAMLIALCLSGEIESPCWLSRRIERDLLCIRSFYAERFDALEWISFRPPWEPGCVVVGFDSLTAQTVMAFHSLLPSDAPGRNVEGPPSGLRVWLRDFNHVHLFGGVSTGPLIPLDESRAQWNHQSTAS